MRLWRSYRDRKTPTGALSLWGAGTSVNVTIAVSKEYQWEDADVELVVVRSESTPVARVFPGGGEVEVKHI